MLPYQKAQVSFKYLKEIGQEGKNSNVFLAHDEHLDANIVIKQIKQKPGNDLDKYLKEARILYKSAHPYVVQICYACTDPDHVYIASPFYKNGSLKSYMAARHLTVREIIRFSTHFLNGLQNIHSKGLIHFDIKPDNILLSDRFEALLADFGQANLMNEDGLAKQPEFYIRQMPPEVFNNPEYIFDNRFDIYQAGLTMYRMCVGDTEFYNQLDKYKTAENFYSDVYHGNFPNRNIYPAHIPKKLKSTINKCLKPNPGERFDSAIDVVNSLADITGNVLDLQYKIDADSVSWEHLHDGKTKIITVANNGESQAYQISDKGAKRKVTAYCKKHIKDDDIIRFFE